MDETQYRAIIQELRVSNELLKAAVSELQQVRSELIRHHHEQSEIRNGEFLNSSGRRGSSGTYFLTVTDGKE